MSNEKYVTDTTCDLSGIVKYSTIHKKDCQFYKARKSQSWDGDFDSVKEAICFLRRAGREINVRFCEVCRVEKPEWY